MRALAVLAAILVAILGAWFVWSEARAFVRARVLSITPKPVKAPQRARMTLADLMPAGARDTVIPGGHRHTLALSPIGK